MGSLLKTIRKIGGKTVFEWISIYWWIIIWFNSRTVDREYGYRFSGERVAAAVTAVGGQCYAALAGICLEGLIGVSL